MQYRILKTSSGQLSIGGIECATLDACIEQVRSTPIADGDQLLKPVDPVDVRPAPLGYDGLPAPHSLLAQLYGCATAWLHNCMAAQLYGCATAWVNNSMVEGSAVWLLYTVGLLDPAWLL